MSETVEQILEKFIPQEKLTDIKRILYGCAFKPLDIAWEDEHFQISGWQVTNQINEELRPPRLVRVGLIQHSIVAGTTEPIQNQRDAVHNKIRSYIVQAAQYQVNILCLQEAWSKCNPLIMYNLYCYTGLFKIIAGILEMFCLYCI